MEFKVGDRVQIKSLEEIKLAFPNETYDGHAKGTVLFNKNMIELCGRTATISTINDNGLLGYTRIGLTDWSNPMRTMWAFTTDMVKHVERVIPRILDEEEM